MVSVTIGLRDKQLIKWFNQICAAMLKVDPKFYTGKLSRLAEDNLKIRRANIYRDNLVESASSELIAVLQAVINEIKKYRDQD